MGWKIHIDPANKNSVIKHWERIEIDEEINSPSKFFVSIPNISKFERDEKIQASHLSKSVIEFSRNGKSVFGGFIEDINYVGRGVEITGRGYEVLLMDENIATQTLLFENTYTATAILGALGGWNLTSGTGIMSFSTKVNARTADIATGNLAVPAKEFSFDTIYNAIHAYTFFSKQEFYVDRHGTNFNLHIGKGASNANTLGDGSATSPKKVYKAGKNIRVTYDNRNLSECVNALWVFGRGDGINRVQVSLPTAVTSDRYPAASAAQEKFGIKWGKVIDTSLTTDDAALEFASGTLDNYLEPIRKLEVESLNYDPSLNLGDYIQVKDAKRGLNDIIRVKRIRREIVLGQREKMIIGVVNAEVEFEKSVNNIEKGNTINRTHQQGATNILTYTADDATDSSQPLTVDIYIPDDMKTVNSALLHLRIERARIIHHQHRVISYFSTSGGGTTKEYTMNVQGSPTTNKVYINSNSTNNLWTGAATMDTGHVAGIHRHADTPDSGTLVGDWGYNATYNSGGTIAGTDGDNLINSSPLASGWNALTITPDTAQEVNHIKANIIVKCYVESK